MTCHHIKNGIFCTPDTFLSLEPYGAKVWCEYHSYLGPSFYRSEKAMAEIRRPSKKTWAAFQAWRDAMVGLE